MTHGNAARHIHLSAALTVLVFCLSAQAGPLEPPVPPGNPTMKPIDQLEPRIPIYAGDLPLTIGQSGSYYLAEDISTTGAGIVVTVNHVTIDLTGFSLRGGTGPGIDGGTTAGLTVRNGVIVGWDGAGLTAGSNTVVADLIVLSNQGNGMTLGPDSRVVRCTANLNGSHGIVVRLGSIVQDSVASTNGENGIWAELGSATSVSTLVTGCHADGNLKNGIRVDGNTVVRGNLCRGNDSAGTQGKAGIWAYGDGNRIENNHLVENNIGLDVSGDYNFIGGNTMRANLQNWRKSATATGNLFPIYNVASPDLPTRWDNIDW